VCISRSCWALLFLQRKQGRRSRCAAEQCRPRIYLRSMLLHRACQKSDTSGGRGCPHLKSPFRDEGFGLMLQVLHLPHGGPPSDKRGSRSTRRNLGSAGAANSSRLVLVWRAVIEAPNSTIQGPSPIGSLDTWPRILPRRMTNRENDQRVTRVRVEAIEAIQPTGTTAKKVATLPLIATHDRKK
jgi:hypothetical protein